MDTNTKFAFIGIGHEGWASSEQDWLTGGADDVISKDYSNLIAVENDVNKFLKHFDDDGCISNIKLINPSKGEVLQSIVNQIDSINRHEESEPGKYALVIYYSGHGDEEYGAMSLSNDVLSAEEVYNQVSSLYEGERIDLDLVMDSCYSGRFIAHALRTERECQKGNVLLYDLWASSLPGEKSFELKGLEHGIFTYCFLNKGNAHINQSEFARAINAIEVDDENDTINKTSIQNLFKYIQGSGVPNPVALMSLGRQHSFTVYRSQHVTVDGGAYFKLPEDITLQGFESTLIDAVDTKKSEVEYSNGFVF